MISNKKIIFFYENDLLLHMQNKNASKQNNFAGKKSEVPSHGLFS